MKELLFIEPVFKHTIWGGDKLRRDFGYPEAGDDIGECWGISAHEQGDCVIRGGSYDKMPLSRLWEQQPALFGNFPTEHFPMIVKIIDAKEDLSIQVHPDDAYASAHENGASGKMESWYILDCPRDASLVIGHNARTREELGEMIENGRWKDFIREVPVQKGDFIHIAPGTVHAIKGGTVLLETQQSSDVTYRVYDYDRLNGGKKRQLHLRQSLDVITVPAEKAENSILHTKGAAPNEWIELVSCSYYSVFLADINGRADLDLDFPFLLISIVEGSGSLGGFAVKKGDHLIVPNGFGSLRGEGRFQAVASAARAPEDGVR